MIKYIGSKRTLVPLITSVAAAPAGAHRPATSSPARRGSGRRSARLGLAVHSNDLATYSEVLGRAYIVADAGRRSRAARRDPRRALGARGPGRLLHRGVLPPGALLPAARTARGSTRSATRSTATRCRRSSGAPPHLAARGRRPGRQHDRAADGLPQGWAPRSYNDARRCGCPSRRRARRARVTRLDANELAPALDVDLVYVDPPYNQHSFFSNYHVWETLVRWDAPESYGVACKRVDCREQQERLQLEAQRAGRASPSCSRRSGRRWLLVSVSDEGFHDAGRARASCSPGIGHVGRIDVDSKRYVGAQIGIYNPSGREGRDDLAPAEPRASLPGRARPRARRLGGRRAGLAFLGASGAERARKTAVTQAAAASGRNGAAGAPSPVAAISTAPASAAGQGPRPRR